MASTNHKYLHHLQQLQNTADRLVTLSRKFTHITPILATSRTENCLQYLHTSVQDNPWCFSDLLVQPFLTIYVPACDNLHSEEKLLLVEHKAKQLWGARSFIGLECTSKQYQSYRNDRHLQNSPENISSKKTLGHFILRQ